MNAFQQGWTLMALGLVGVFGSLVLFYIFIRVLLKLSAKRNRQ